MQTLRRNNKTWATSSHTQLHRIFLENLFRAWIAMNSHFLWTHISANDIFNYSQCRYVAWCRRERMKRKMNNNYPITLTACNYMTRTHHAFVRFTFIHSIGSFSWPTSVNVQSYLFFFLHISFNSNPKLWFGIQITRFPCKWAMHTLDFDSVNEII